MGVDTTRRKFSWADHHPVWTFLALTFAWTWFWWGLAVLIGVGEGPSPLLMIGALGPAMAAWMLSRTREYTAGDKDLRRHRWTYFGAAVVGVGVLALYAASGGKLTSEGAIIGLGGALLLLAVVLVAWVVATARSPDPGVRARMASLLAWRKPWWLWATAVLIYPAILAMGAALAWALGAPVSLPEAATRPLTEWVPIFLTGVLITGFFRGGLEELGWRGFMLPQLQRRVSPLTASLLIAVAWSFWHLPLHMTGFYDGSVVIEMMLRTVEMIPLAILFTWLYNRSGGSLLLVVVLHAVHNNADVIVPMTYWSFVPGLLVIGGLAIWDRMWRRLPTDEATESGNAG